MEGEDMGRTTEAASLRDRAITIREEWIRHERRRIPRHRGDQEWSAEEHREYSREQIARWQRSIGTLRAMATDVADEDVRAAMGVAS